MTELKNGTNPCDISTVRYEGKTWPVVKLNEKELQAALLALVTLEELQEQDAHITRPFACCSVLFNLETLDKYYPLHTTLRILRGKISDSLHPHSMLDYYLHNSSDIKTSTEDLIESLSAVSARRQLRLTWLNLILEHNNYPY